jgi:hypothetical protein
MTQPIYRFPGFSLPEGAWLPPEILELLPYIQTVAELKVTIAAIYETMRMSGPNAIISLTDFEALTGLARKSVIRGIEAAIERKTITRTPVGGTYIYQLNINNTSIDTSAAGLASVTMTPPGSGKMTLAGSGKMTPTSGKSPPIGVKMTPNSVKTTPHVDSCNMFLNKNKNMTHVASGKMTLANDDSDIHRIHLLREMRALGVALKVANNMIIKYDLSFLQEKLEQARYAVESGLADNGPGWFVASIRKDWQPPLGYRPAGEDAIPPPVQDIQEKTIQSSPPDPPLPLQPEIRETTEEQNLDDLRRELQLANPTLNDYLQQATLTLQDDTLTLTLQSPHHKAWIDARLRPLIQAIVNKYYSLPNPVVIESN